MPARVQVFLLRVFFRIKTLVYEYQIKYKSKYDFRVENTTLTYNQQKKRNRKSMNSEQIKS